MHHIFWLIVILNGGPEHIALTCDTYKECSDAGAALAEAYVEMFHLTPDSVSYRVVEHKR